MSYLLESTTFSAHTDSHPRAPVKCYCCPCDLPPLLHHISVLRFYPAITLVSPQTYYTCSNEVLTSALPEEMSGTLICCSSTYLQMRILCNESSLSLLKEQLPAQL